jgi:hypothetical protein
MEGPAINPDLALFIQDDRLFEVQGALDGTQLSTALQFHTEYRNYIVSGQTPIPTRQYVLNLSWFEIEGPRDGEVFAERTGLYQVEGTKDTATAIIQTALYQITTN